MTVDQSRNDRAALEVDDPGRGGDVCCHLGVGPDRDDPFAGDGDRLRNREILVDGDDLPFPENEIDWASERRSWQ
jgi:hypothetical protein